MDDLSAAQAFAPSRRRWLAGAGCAAVAGVAGLHAGRARAAGLVRVALVIGNAAYPSSPLRNPLNDAKAMAELLESLGFEVVLAADAGRAQMLAALAQAAAALHGRQGVGLLYYAGHGLQIDWRNYMLPVDIRIETAADVPRQGVDVQQVLTAFQRAGVRTNILVLDACRDNPFGAGGPRGLAPMDAPPGTFFAYATAPGNVAEDGTAAEGNGLYTRYLLQEMKKPEARIEDVFKRVRLQVRLATQGRQIPWESTSLEEDFVFASGEAVAAPNARQRLREFDEQRTTWARLRETGRAEELAAFIARDPQGPFVELAQFALDRVAPQALRPQLPAALAALASRPPPGPGQDRYRVGDTWTMAWTDHLRGDQRELRPYRVSAIEGMRVLVNDGRVVMDQMGNVIENELGRRDPGILMVPAELSVGRRWHSAYYSHPLSGGAPSRVLVDHRVEALEDVELPLGRFRAWRIGMTGSLLRASDGADLRATMWVDAATLWPLRTVRHFTRMHRDIVEMKSTEELVAWQRAPR
ncbi:MAG: caspase family protein [Rubrivivax sp.]|nr:caspase family protein [Rubrivivax sp.]